ncbi:hypothetical protein ACP70R_019142 [Stipagrostis hirtigluma subsp. patula]
MAGPHALVFPWPLQGHINGMLHFATALLDSGVHVTFLHTDHSLRRLGRAATASASPRFRVLSVPDGLPDDHPRSAGDLAEIAESMRTATAAVYRALLASLVSAGGSPSHPGDAVDGGFPPVTCVVADGLLPFAIDVAEELGVPALAFRTSSACSFLAYHSVHRLLELGELPFPEGGDLDAPVRGVPGMEGLLRRRDLPIQCRRCTQTHDDPVLRMAVTATVHTRNARALVFNTAASLERAALAQIAPHVRDVFAVGPLHAASPSPAAATASLWREDDGCLAWLDGQADRSVVYVSLGSLAVLSREQLAEFLSGLLAAGYPFLWVLRPDMVDAGQDAALREAIAAAGKDARVVAWAPQRDVLRHRAVGCFLTHAGWNSTMEGVAEGTPMVCWPFFGDQQVNSRFVAAVWGVGLDMKDACDRAVVERAVREAMESEEIRTSAQAMAQRVRRDVADGGSSATELKRLVRFIKELSKPAAESPRSAESEHQVA